MLHIEPITASPMHGQKRVKIKLGFAKGFWRRNFQRPLPARDRGQKRPFLTGRFCQGVFVRFAGRSWLSLILTNPDILPVDTHGGTMMSSLSGSMFHDGHRELQDKFDGRRMADALEKHRRFSEFREQDVTFIEGAEFFFIATAHGQSVDCSFRGGAAGFVRVTGPTRLEWSDYDGNSMYRSLGNALRSPRVGLLFIEFGAQPKRLRVNGICSLSDGPPTEGHKMIVQVEADEIFPNCPRYIPDLSKNAASAFIPDETGASIKPDWKNAEDLREALPEYDPHRGQ